MGDVRMKDAAGFVTDSTAFGTVSVCRCGWRYAGATAAENARACRDHVHAVHGDDKAAKRAAINRANYQTRHARSSKRRIQTVS
ncbi:hypothetical protein [Nocardia rhizosphaerae]|uniref:Uncharacterized protein n=1 Tax=Nocardia rhizosphaerae TaxID=1691571 RepID=A0ABV8LAR2_9NOCA